MATGVAGDPVAPGSRSGGAVSMKRLRPAAAQPARQRRQVPQLTEMDAELEQAMFVQRCLGAAGEVFERRVGFHGEIVGDQNGRARFR